MFWIQYSRCYHNTKHNYTSKQPQPPESTDSTDQSSTTEESSTTEKPSASDLASSLGCPVLSPREKQLQYTVFCCYRAAINFTFSSWTVPDARGRRFSKKRHRSAGNTSITLAPTCSCKVGAIRAPPVSLRDLVYLDLSHHIRTKSRREFCGETTRTRTR